MRLTDLSLAFALASTPASAFFSPPASSSKDDSNTTSGAADLSDGKDIKPRQPLLDAEDWFLTKQELTGSRGGIPRDDMSVYTTGNKVTSYTVTNEVYNAVYDELSATTVGDRVLLAAWSLALVPLKPDIDSKGNTTGIKEVFAGVVKRGGSVNILNWATIASRYTSYNIKARNAINSIPPSPINGAKAVLIFDDRYPRPFMSHHQKNMVIAVNSSMDPDEQPVAYVGGVEFTNDRWDTISHNNSEIREAAKLNHLSEGWVDGHLRIHGPAAKDVANNFVARWNSDYLPCDHIDDRLRDFRNPKYEHILPLDYVSSNTTGSLGSQSVQITRTYSCFYEHYEFAPRGETSLFWARIKAIKNAKNFIYVEDQYFILVPELLDTIMQMMPTIQRLVVITSPQASFMDYAGYSKYLYESVEPIRSKYPNKFAIYTTKAKRNIAIHSKLVIIDDVYLSIGSANWNRRSMTSDSEVNANVVDTDTVMAPEGVYVGKMPRDFRIRKFHEMTGLSYKKLDAMTFVEASDQLALAVANVSSILDINKIVHKAYFFTITDKMRKMSDPQDTCKYNGNKKNLKG
uniref:phospholipase D n=1 Tax=Hyaloperonospora arabidopsidis (strain Emoy2) TaxID=559515 RepID=M4BZC5_HYAAE